MSGLNVLSGSMDIVGGTLAIGGDGKLTSGTVSVSGAMTLLTLGSSIQNVGAFNLVDGFVADGTLVASSYALSSGSISAVLSGGATVTKGTAGLVSLSGMNVLSG